MIPVANIGRQSETWQTVLREAVRDSTTLLGRLGLEADPVANDADRSPSFRVLVPEPFIQRMRRGDPKDPLLLQVLATRAEQVLAPGFVAEPLQERDFERAPGLLQKYRGRALLMAATACAVNCRYCFRRHFPYAEHQGAQSLPAEVKSALLGDVSLHEVILSGGDPLMLGDRQLGELLTGLADIPHLRTVRIHTRLPIVIPARVTRGLTDALRTNRLRTVVVLHVNHAAELDEEVGEALAQLRAAGALLLNQSVLLRGVNDDDEALVNLSEALFAHGVLPYYLHLLDPVAGAAHFDVPEAEAVQLIGAVRGRLPGYLVPRLVREVPGSPSKTPVS